MSVLPQRLRRPEDHRTTATCPTTSSPLRTVLAVKLCVLAASMDLSRSHLSLQPVAAPESCCRWWARERDAFLVALNLTENEFDQGIATLHAVLHHQTEGAL
ncbi:hypothetical protein [Nocardia carnea]|uniref:hypothetical protein n=1 Tax=Nocardia carnea TaxID=37328 RepID=UPI0024580C45|nr:hypothetical protein [Nocardia carnea]